MDIVEFAKYCNENEIEPIMAIIWACKSMDWLICVEKTDNDDDIITGLVVGTDDYVNAMFDEKPEVLV